MSPQEQMVLGIRIYLGRALALLAVPVSGYPLWQLASYTGTLQSDNLLFALGYWALFIASMVLLIFGPVGLSIGLHALITPGADEVEDYFEERRNSQETAQKINKQDTPCPQDLSQVEEEMDEAVRITRVAQRQAAASYVNINREVSAFFRATEQIENQAGDMSPHTRRDLHLARLAYFERLADNAREGQQIIRRYLREI
jgi:hypothetical protein